MTAPLTFTETELPSHSAWECTHVGDGTAIWARQVPVAEFADAENISAEAQEAYRTTGSTASYQIELITTKDETYSVSLMRSTGPDSAGVVTEKCRPDTEAKHALTHITHLLHTYANPPDRS